MDEPPVLTTWESDDLASLFPGFADLFALPAPPSPQPVAHAPHLWKLWDLCASVDDGRDDYFFAIPESVESYRGLHDLRLDLTMGRLIRADYMSDQLVDRAPDNDGVTLCLSRRCFIHPCKAHWSRKHGKCAGNCPPQFHSHLYYHKKAPFFARMAHRSDAALAGTPYVTLICVLRRAVMGPRMRNDAE